MKRIRGEICEDFNNFTAASTAWPSGIPTVTWR